MPEPRPVIPSKRLKKWTPEPLAAGDARHGTANGYVNYGCRFVPCVEARKADRAQRRGEGPKGNRAPVAELGTRSAYSAGCRCDSCRAAVTAAAREDREKNKK